MTRAVFLSLLAAPLINLLPKKKEQFDELPYPKYIIGVDPIAEAPLSPLPYKNFFILLPEGKKIPVDVKWEDSTKKKVIITHKNQKYNVWD